MAKPVLTRSFTSDDSFTAAKTGLTEDSVSTVVLDVMANDGGGKNKTLYSIDDGRNSTSDLLVQDTARTEIGSRDRSANGATIWITADGKVAYDASTISADFRAELQELSAGESMQDSFTYAVMVNGNLSWAKVTIQIAGLNDAPVITSAAQVGLVQEDVRFVATGRVTATDVDGEDHDDDHHDEHRDDHDDHDGHHEGHGHDEDQDGLRFAVLGSNVGTYGSITVNAETGRWTYSLNNGAANVQALGATESHNEVFTIRVRDEHGAYADQAVTVTVRGSNDGPVITSTAQAGSVEEDVTVSATGQVKASDIDNGDHQHFSVVGAGNGSYGSLSVDAASGVWTYTLNNGAANVQALAANETHTESFTVRVADDSGAYADQTVLVTVKGTNDAPVITSAAQSAGVQEDVNLGATGQVAASDVDLGDHQQFAVVGGGAGAYGSLNVDAATGVWTYSLNNGSAAVQSLAAGETHNETFTVRVTDDQGATADQVVTVQVAGANDGPVMTNDVAATTGAVQEDAALAASGQLSASDVDHGATQAWSVVGSADGAYGSIAVDASGKWTYSLANGSAAVQSLAAGETHNETFTIRVTDDKGAVADQVVTVQVAGSNDGPVVANTAAASAGAVQEDATLVTTGQLSAGDVDHNATQSWSVVGSADGAYGSIAVDASGQWTYSLANGSAAVQSLAAGETHNETFTVRVTDDHGATADQVVTVQVTGTNDAPVISGGNVTGAVQEDLSSQATGHLDVIDPDHGARQFWSVVGGAPVHAADYEFKADSFTVIRNGGTLLVDGFSNGVPPPDSPNFGNGTPTSYGILGGFGESGGRLLLDSDYAVPIDAPGTPDPFIGEGAMVKANNLTTDANFSIRGVFDLILPDSPREMYGIRAGDRLIGGSGNPPDQLGDDVFDLVVRENILGQDVVTLRHYDFVHDVTTNVESVTLAAPSNANQILLKLDHATNSSVLTASFQYLHDGVAIGGVQNFGQTASIFHGENWTRAGLVAYAPAFTDSNLGGSYGTLNINQSGNWTYSLNNALASTQSLAQGQTATETFDVKVADEFGAIDTRAVTITVTGSNDGPVMETGPALRSLTEDATVPNLNATGFAQFGDVDLTDGHTVSATFANATMTGGGALPSGLSALVGTAVSAHLTDAATGDGHGQIQWDFALANGATQFLAAGQTMTLVYHVNVTDTFGATATQAVTISIAGTNDAPVITSAAQTGAVSEGDDGSLVTATGQVTFSDADTSDGHTYGSTAAQHGTAAVDAAGHWTYTAADSGAVDALARGETLNDSFVVTVDDGHGGATSQTVNLTITGTNDAATITGDASGTVSEDGVLQAAGQLSAHDVDNGEAHVQVLSGVAGSYGTFSVDANGTWSYTLNNDAAAVQALDTGESLHDVFTVVSQDGTASQDVTVTINGLNDRVPPVANDDQIEFRSGGVLTFEPGNWLGQDYNHDNATNKDTYTYHYENLSETYSQRYDSSQGWVYADFNVKTNEGFQFTSGEMFNGGWGAWVTGGWYGADYSSALYSYGSGNGNPVATTPAIEMTRVDGGVFSIDIVNITSEDYSYYYYYYGNNAIFHETVKGYLDGVEVAVQSFDVPAENTTGIHNNVVDLTATGFNSVDRVEFTLTADYTNSYYSYYGTYQWIDNITLGAGASNLLANDTDTDPTAHLSVNSYDHMTTLGGSVTVAANGDTTYDSSASAAVQALAAGESAVDTFTYDIHDQYGNVSNRATASITVHGVNDAATISGHSAGSVTEDVNLQTTGQLTISDPDHGQSHAKVESFTGSYGSFSVDADGNWNYTLNNASANVQSLAQDERVTDSFTVTSQDGTAHQQVVVTITGTNDAPLAVADQVLPTLVNFEYGNYLGGGYVYSADGYTYSNNYTNLSQWQTYSYSTGQYTYGVTQDGYQFTSGIGLNNYNYTSGYDANGNYYYDYHYGYGPNLNGGGGADYSTSLYTYGNEQYQYYNYSNTDVGVVHLGIAATEMTRTDGGVFSIASANINDSAYAYAYQYNYYGYNTNTLLGVHETVTGFLHGVQVAQQSFDASNGANWPNNVVNLTDAGFTAVDHVEFRLSADFTISSDPNYDPNNYYYYYNNYSYAYANGYQYLDNVAINLTSSTPTDIKVLANDTDIDHGAVLSIGVYQTDSLMGAEITENANGTLHYDPTSSLLLASLNARDAVTDVFQYTTEDQYGAGSDWADVNVTVHGNVHSNVFAIHANDPVHQISGFNGAESQFGGGGDVLDIRDLLPANTHLDNSNITEYLEAVSTNGGHDTALYVDSDGAGAGAAVQVATLLGVTNLFLFDLLDNHNVQYA